MRKDRWSVIWIYFNGSQKLNNHTNYFKKMTEGWRELLDLRDLKVFEWDPATGPADHGVRYVIWAKDP